MWSIILMWSMWSMGAMWSIGLQRSLEGGRYLSSVASLYSAKRIFMVIGLSVYGMFEKAA
jgi:hypothetical protein